MTALCLIVWITAVILGIGSFVIDSKEDNFALSNYQFFLEWQTSENGQMRKGKK